MSRRAQDSTGDRMKKTTRQITDDDKFRMCLAIDYSWTMLEAERKGLNSLGATAVTDCALNSLENQDPRSIAYNTMLDLYGDPSKKSPASRFVAETLVEGAKKYLRERDSKEE